MSRLLLAALAIPFSPALLCAQLDAEADKPYHLQLVLSFAERRVFTSVFRENVERELRDSLQTAFGDLVRVTAVREHPLLEEAWSKGLRPTLDGVRLVSDTKTHFVLIDSHNGLYEIQARQHDGATGLASPEVRRAHTGDRLLVARTAALMVAQDFGAIGTLPAVTSPIPQGQRLTVTLKGGRLGSGVERLVKKDEIFLVAQMTQTAAGLRSALVPGAVLQVTEEPREGACVCQLYFRYTPALPAGTGVVGFRCLKVATGEGRLRLRVVRDDNRRESLGALSVALSQHFGDRDPAETQTTSQNELLQSRQVYRHLAFARVFKDNVPLTVRFPVPLLGDLPQTCPVGVRPEAERRGALETRLRNWGRRWYDTWLVYGTLVAEFNKASETAPETAVKTSRNGLAQMRSDLLSLDSELRAIRADVGKVKLDLTPELAEGEQRMAELRTRYETLAKLVSELEEALVKQNDPRIKEWQTMLQRARVLEAELEFDEALALYERVLKDAPNVQKDLREHVAKLKSAWALKDDEHRAARVFIYQTWAKLKGAAQIKDRLPDAWRFFEVCRGNGDQFTLRKLLRVGKDLVAQLAKENDTLRPDANDDDRRAAEIIVETSGELGKLLKAVSAEVEKPANP